MATFTSTSDLNIRWLGNDLVGPAGTVHRIPDALYDEFDAAYGAIIPGLSWTSTDEIDGVTPVAQTDVTGLTAALAGKADTSALTAYVETASLSAYVPKSGATMTGTLTGPAFAPTGRPWFDVKAYGATGDGATDDLTAIQSAVSAAVAAGGGTVYFPSGTYLVSSLITLSSDITLLGVPGSSHIRATTGTYVVRALGTLGTLRTVATDIARGTSVVALSSGGSDFTAGSGMWIQSEAQALDEATHKKGELQTVLSVSSNTVTVAGSAMDVYATADTAKVGAVTFVENVVLRDLKFTSNIYTTSTTTATNGLLRFELCRNVRIEGCDVAENNGAGIQLYNVLGAHVLGNHIENLRDAGSSSGYGVDVGYGSRGIVVQGNRISQVRHGVTLDVSNAGTTPNYGVVRQVTIADNAVADTTHFAIDTHEDCDGLSITGNVVVNSQSGGGIQVRGYHATVSGNQIHNCKDYGIYIRPTARYATVTGNIINGTLNNYGILIDTEDVVCSGNNVSNSASHGIAVTTNASRGVLIIGNLSLDNGVSATGDGININAAITRLVLTGNICTDSRSAKLQRYGIRFESAVTESARVGLTGNIVSDNLSGGFSNGGSGSPMAWANSPADAPNAVQRVRVTTPTIAASATSSLTLTWPHSFSDTNYSAIVTAQESGAFLRVNGITSRTATTIVVSVTNTDGGGGHVGALHALGFHD